MKLNGRRVVIAVSFLVSALVSGSLPAEAQEEEQVTPIKPPARPLPDETASAGVTKYSFIAYGDTRGRRDGIAIQYEHSRSEEHTSELQSLTNLVCRLL